jgi:aspartate kinase
MPIIVQKYGGSSVATNEKLRFVARRIVNARRQGHQVVAVVSAMGDTTSKLLGQAREIAPDPRYRELDMLLSSGEQMSMSLLSMAIHELGEDAISLTGPQSGIYTTDTHSNARIEAVEPERVRDEVSRGRIVIVAGFQGLNAHGEVTTLGRGGSDTTAVAMAAAMQAERCEIYSDVDGIYSADPRMVDGAMRLPEISYEEMQELARHGAKVLNPRAVNYAWKRDVAIHARSTFSENRGTIIHGQRQMVSPEVIGMACHKALIKVSVPAKDAEGGLGDEVADAVGEGNIFLHNVDTRARELLVSTENIADTVAFVQRLNRDFPEAIDVASDIGSVSAVGLNVGGCKNTASAAAKAIATTESPLLGTYRSDHALTWVLDKGHVRNALRGLHRTFVEQGDTKEVA